jgi:hypothetical protein
MRLNEETANHYVDENKYNPCCENALTGQTKMMQVEGGRYRLAYRK